MPRKRHTPEQIISKLREAEVGLAGGHTVPEVCRTLVERQAKVATNVTSWKLDYILHLCYNNN